MALTIKDILGKNLFEGLSLAAGRDGSNNLVTWINLMEILDTPDNVAAGELLITTGYDLSDCEKQKNLISRLQSRGVSGMLVQTGYYLDRIPDFILEAADACQFPVLLLPSRYTFSEILHVMVRELGRSQNDISSSYLDYPRFFSALSARLAPSDTRFFSDQVRTYLFGVSDFPSVSAPQKALLDAFEQIRSFLASHSLDLLYEISGDGQAVFCISAPEAYDLSAIFYDLQIQLTFLSERENIHLYAGVDRLPSPEHLHLTLKHVQESIALLSSIEAKRGICPYENYTFIKMFGYLYQNNHSFVLENQALQALLTRDRNHHTNYVQTVRIYLSENCNVTHTAERLYIHRHTLINRIQAIRELCGIDFDDYYTRMYLSLSLMIHDYYAV